MKEKADKQNPADEIVLRKVSGLVPYARNARKHSDAQIGRIAASIKEWGWTTPVLISPDGGIIAGHGRVLAAQRLNIKDVPCVVAEGWSETKTKAYALADNRLAELSEWDDELLSLELAELQGEDFDLSLIGFDPADLDDMLQQDIEDDCIVPDKDPNVLVRVSFHPGVWLGKREEIMSVMEKLKKTYECDVRVEE